jgi:crossover junction endodeoxyribonuclease RusA
MESIVIECQTYHFFVPGKPATAGSKRAFPFKRSDGSLGVNVAHDNKQFASYRLEVAWLAEHAEGFVKFCRPKPVSLTLYCFFERPVSHFTRTGKLRCGVNPSYISKPDLSKIQRAIEDALTGVAYDDDCQITRVFALKQYGEQTGVHVSISGYTGASDG